MVKNKDKNTVLQIDNFTSAFVVFLFPFVNFVTQLRDLMLIFCHLRWLHVHLSSQSLHTRSYLQLRYCRLWAVRLTKKPAV